MSSGAMGDTNLGHAGTGGMNQHPLEGKSMQLNQKLNEKRASPFEKE